MFLRIGSACGPISKTYLSVGLFIRTIRMYLLLQSLRVTVEGEWSGIHAIV